MTTSCQIPMARPTAASLGQAADQNRRARPGTASSWSSRASRPESSAARRSFAAGWTRPPRSRIAMAAHLLAQALGDLTGESSDGRVLDAAGPGRVDPELLGHLPGAAREHDDAVAQAGRLPHVVGDEQDGEAPLLPE